MPETPFTLRWPDGEVERCYSPSSVVREFLTAGATYPMDDFLYRCRTALERASQRVEVKFGYRCTSADAQLAAIEQKASTYSKPANVTCLAIS